MELKHLDLFSGIGGFALACRWNGIETICFCEIDEYCQEVLAKHFPNVPIVKDVNNVEEIERIINNTTSIGYWSHNEIQARRNCLVNASCQTVTITKSEGLEGQAEGISQWREQGQERDEMGNGHKPNNILLTAGFPCQPFSIAGRKRGSDDDRYLWPQTLKVIEAVKPNWIILENVPGILNMVFPNSGITMDTQRSLFQDRENGTGNIGGNRQRREYDTIIGTIMGDIRSAGYEATLLVLPACSLAAPHRRDRVWIIANARSQYGERTENNGELDGTVFNQETTVMPERSTGYDLQGITPNTISNGNGQLQESTGCSTKRQTNSKEQEQGRGQYSGQSHEQVEFCNFATNEINNVADTNNATPTRQRRNSREIHGIAESGRFDNNHRIPEWSKNWYEVATEFCRVDDGIPNRVDRLKSLGNAIVPQVAYEIIKNIKDIENGLNK